MRKILDNKRGGNKLITGVMISLLIVVAFAVVYYVWSDTQQTAKEDQIIISQQTTPTGLTGKPATVSVYALDVSNSDKTTKAVGDLYIITDPVITGDTLTGGFVSDGTALSTSARTAVTTGLTVGTKIAAISSNSTYFGFPTDVMTVGTSKSGANYVLSGLGQSQTLDIDVYKTAPALKLTLTEDNAAITVTATASNNLTVGASQTTVIDEMAFEMNLTNVAVNLAGFYVDLPADTNISTISIASTSSGISESSLNLKNTEADDYVFEFSSPILMDAWDKVEFDNAIQLEGDSDGCTAGAGDIFTIYVFDKIWTKSQDSSSMIYAAESDGSSPADVGMANEAYAYYAGN